MPFFSRLETGFLLGAQNLRPFLIARLAIRKCVTGWWESVDGWDTVLRLSRLFDPTVVTAAINVNSERKFTIRLRRLQGFFTCQCGHAFRGTRDW